MTIKLCGCLQARSVPGLVHSIGLCQKHYNGLVYGPDEARKEARRYMYAVHMPKALWEQHKLLNKITE